MGISFESVLCWLFYTPGYLLLFCYYYYLGRGSEGREFQSVVQSYQKLRQAWLGPPCCSWDFFSDFWIALTKKTIGSHCWQHSFALATVCAWAGCKVDVVIGVQNTTQRPFSHAWVEQDGVPLEPGSPQFYFKEIWRV